MKNFARIRLSMVTALLFVIGVAMTTTLAQSPNVDAGFSAVPAIPLNDEVTFQHVVQPDGKIIGFNSPLLVVNGVVRGTIFRLNADGSVDTTFSYCECGGIVPESAMLTPDGKIIMAGSDGSTAKMIRLNPDGSIDPAFSVISPTGNNPDLSWAGFKVNAIQPDGRVIVTRSSWLWQSGTGQVWTHVVTRYDANGIIDSTFNPILLPSNFFVSSSALIDLLPDGRFYMAVTAGNNLGFTISLRRWQANGTADPSWTEFTRSAPGGSVVMFRDIQAVDDGVLVSGKLSSSTGVRGFIKVIPSGVDPSFASPNVYEGFQFERLPNGGYLYSMRSVFAFDPIKMIRLTSAGVIDNTYVMDPTIGSIVNDWDSAAIVQPVFLARIGNIRRLVRLLDQGTIDPGFNAPLMLASSISRSAIQADEKIIVAGPFTEINGVARSRIARLNADGTLDSTFNPGLGFDAQPGRIVIQPDGKILVAGNFGRFNGELHNAIVRLNPNGSRDTSFTVSPNDSVFTVMRQSDGKILIGGLFTSVNGVGRTNLARLEANGELDPTFNPVLDGDDRSVGTILMEPDGKLMIAGRFTGVGGVERMNVARLESNGVLDTSFNAGGVPSIGSILRQSDGKYILGEGQIRRRNIDGTVDAGFTPPFFTRDGSFGGIEAVMLLSNGDIIVGGSFDSAGGVPRKNIARLKPNGTVGPDFVPAGTNGSVRALTAYGNGRLLVSGEFSTIDNVFRLGIARLNAAANGRKAPFDFDGDGRADISVYRPSTNRWYEALSSGPIVEETFGIAGDVLVPADFDGDGKTDEAVFRPQGGQWWYKSSVDGSIVLNTFGQIGDIPRPSDIDGDGKADLVLFRPSTSTWIRFGTLVGNVPDTPFGIAGDQPLVGDFDGDGKGDVAIFRPSNGDWWYAASSAGGAFVNAHWGQNGDIPVPADYDGDGKTDYAIFRPSDGGWYIYNSGNGSITTTAFGTNTDRPVAADYDGDGRADIAVFRPSTGIWYLLRSTSGFAGYQFGISTDIAIPGALIP